MTIGVWRAVAGPLMLAALVIGAIGGAGLARGQSRDITASTPREHRVALVIGNAAYTESPLHNPANDARGMAQALRAQGFEVVERVNADLLGMRRAAAEFGARLREGGVALFYYSGHGIQANGRNYLVPVGAQIGSETYVSAETLEVDSGLARSHSAAAWTGSRSGSATGAWARPASAACWSSTTCPRASRR